MSEIIKFDFDIYKMPRFAGVRVALVLAITALCIIVWTMCLGIGIGVWNVLPAHFSFAVFLLVLSWGCLSLRRWAWWISLAVSGLCVGYNLYRLPGTISALSNSLPAHIADHQLGKINVYFEVLSYLNFVTPFLMAATLIFLILPATRRAFHIGTASVRNDYETQLTD